MIKVELKGVEKTVKELQKIAQKSAPEIQQALNDFGQNVATTAKTLAPTDEGNLKNSIASRPTALAVEIVVAADYAAYVEFGTRKFAAAYVSGLPTDWQTFAREFQGPAGGTFAELVTRLTAWMKRKGYDEQNAYRAALRIVRDGTKAQPYLYPAYDIHRKELIEDLKHIFDR